MNKIKEISESVDNELLDRFRRLPIQLNACDVAVFLGISRSSAYKVMDSEGFPKKKIPGIERTVIPKQRFIEWYAATFELSLVEDSSLDNAEKS